MVELSKGFFVSELSGSTLTESPKEPQFPKRPSRLKQNQNNFSIKNS